MTKNKILAHFSEVVGAPYTWLKNHVNSSSQKTIGYFCNYTPFELLHAAGFLPVRIWGNQNLSPKVNTHLQSYCCFMVKSALSLLLDGKLDFLHGALFSHSCDSMQCLSDIWELNARSSFHDTFNMPTKLDGDASLDYTIQELHRIRNRLETFIQQPISYEKLASSIKIYNESRRLTRRLYQLRRDSSNLLTGIEFNNIIIASAILPVEKYIELLKSLLDLLNQATDENEKTPRLLMVGSILNDPPIYKMIENLNARIVDDDLCSGSRFFSREVKVDENPIKAIAESLIQHIPCPCKHQPDFDRAKYLIQRFQESGADGIVFYLQKYCDPHFSEYPDLKDSLDAAAIPSLLIEAERPGQNVGQIENRLQAFLEMIKQS